MSPRWRLLAGLLLGLGGAFLFSSGALASVVLQVFADPPRLRADGRSTSVIIAQVQDESGGAVSDGTPVTFTTTLGSISPAAETRGGVARAVLSSGSAVGTAIVSVMVAGARQDLEVEFVAEGGESQQAASILRLEGKQVTYNRQSGLAIVSEGGRFECGAITIRAAAMQCDLAGAHLAAQGNVEVSNGKETLCGEAVVFRARQGRGSLLKYEGVARPTAATAAAEGGLAEEAAVYAFYAPGLEMSREQKSDLDEFRPLRERTSRTLVMAKQILVRPDGQIMFDDATVLVDGVKLLSLPHYVVGGMRGDQGIIDQMVRLNSGYGITADFPYYYAAKPGRIGSLRLTHNLTPEGALLQRGWALSLEEQYLLGEKGRGTLNVDDLLGESRGLRWTHSQELAPNFRAFASLRYTRFDADSPRVMDANTTFSRILPGLALDLSLRASAYAESTQYLALLSARTHPRPIATSGFSYSTGLRLSYVYGTTVSLVYSPEEGSASVIRSGKKGTLAESLSFRLHSPQWKLDEKTTLDSGLVLSSAWSEGSARQSLSAMASLRRRIGETGSLGITYSGLLTRRQGSANYLTRRQSLTFNLSALCPGKWETFGFASYELEDSRFFGSGILRYYLPFQRSGEGDPLWAVSISGVLYKWSSQRAMDTKVGLARAIGNWEVSLNYSPHGSEFGSGFLGGSSGLLGLSGYGYTQELGRTFWIEVAPRAF